MADHNDPILAKSAIRGRTVRHSFVGWFIILMITMTAITAVSGVVSAQGSVGVSPATLLFVDPPVLAGGTQQGTVHFQQHYDDPVEVSVAVVALNGEWGDAANWLDLDRSGRMTLSPGSHSFQVQITAPEHAANGLYKAGVQFRAHPPNVEAYEGSRSIAETSVTSTVVIQIDNENEVKGVAVAGTTIFKDAEVDRDLHFMVPLANTGNVDANPHVLLEVFDQSQNEVLHTQWFNETILAPGEKGEHGFVVTSHGLAEGQYWAKVSVFLDGDLIVAGLPASFDVLKEGALARNVELRKVGIHGNMTAVATDTHLRVTALVSNIGEVHAVGQFHGEVYRDGELVAMIQSSPREVSIGSELVLNTLYTPDLPGRYEIKGHVAYEGKVTEEKSVLVVVEGAPGNGMSWLPVGIVIAGIGIIGSGVVLRKGIIGRR